jgi:hypothetical protein
MIEILIIVLAVAVALTLIGGFGYNHYRNRPAYRPDRIRSEFVVERPVLEGNRPTVMETDAGRNYSVDPAQSQNAGTTRVTPIVPGSGT